MSNSASGGGPAGQTASSGESSASSGSEKDAISCATEQVRKLAAQAAEVGEQVYRQAEDAGRYAGRLVEEQPWAVIIATGLAGLAIGVLLGRGSAPRPRSARDYVDDYLPQRLRRH